MTESLLFASTTELICCCCCLIIYLLLLDDKLLLLLQLDKEIKLALIRGVNDRESRVCWLISEIRVPCSNELHEVELLLAVFISGVEACIVNGNVFRLLGSDAELFRFDVFIFLECEIVGKVVAVVAAFFWMEDIDTDEVRPVFRVCCGLWLGIGGGCITDFVVLTLEADNNTCQ